MRLLEFDQQNSVPYEKLYLVIDLLGQHVNLGRLRDVDYKKIYDILPRPKSVDHLYRVESMSAEQYEEYKKTKKFVCPGNQYTFWTGNPSNVKALAKMAKEGNSGVFSGKNTGPGSKIILLDKVFQPTDIVVNINAFLATYEKSMTSSQYNSVSEHQWEDESIVYESTRSYNSSNMKFLNDSLAQKFLNLFKK